MGVITLKVNGKNISKEVSDSTLLSDFLREKLALTGTHIGCDTSMWSMRCAFEWKFSKELHYLSG